MGTMDTEFKLNDRVLIDNEKATVLYIGEVPPTKGLWLGVEWDNPDRGKHDGTHEGKKYFETRSPTSGSFVRPRKVDRGVPIDVAVENRYGFVEGKTAGVEEQVMKDLQREMNAPFLQMVGFDKVNQCQSVFHKLKTVWLQECRVNGPGLKDLSQFIGSVNHLDLSFNLLPSWNVVADIGKQLPKLSYLAVSGNRLAPPTGSFVIQNGFPRLKHLVLGNSDMGVNADSKNRWGYDWNDILRIVGSIPTLEVLQAHENRIADIAPLEDGVLENLKELHLSENPIQDWKNLMAFAKLPNLQLLIANNCGLQSIDIPSDNGPFFRSLKYLHLSNNQLKSWSDFGQLNKLSLTDLRVRGNPILLTEPGDVCRQIIIASIGSLKVVNGTEIVRSERYGGELDYMKMFGKEYLKILKITDADEKKNALDQFDREHSRYLELVAKYGAPEEYELKEVDTSIKGSLLNVTVSCPGKEGFSDQVRQLPPHMTIQKLRTLLQRVTKIKGKDMSLSYVNAKHPDLEIPLDNDMRDLSFYDIQHDDKILVRHISFVEETKRIFPRGSMVHT